MEYAHFSYYQYIILFEIKRNKKFENNKNVNSLIFSLSWPITQLINKKKKMYCPQKFAYLVSVLDPLHIERVNNIVLYV